VTTRASTSGRGSTPLRRKIRNSAQQRRRASYRKIAARKYRKRVIRNSPYAQPTNRSYRTSSSNRVRAASKVPETRQATPLAPGDVEV